MSNIKPSTAAAYGLSTNDNGGTYRQGAKYPRTKELAVLERYIELKEEGGGCRPNIAQVARDTTVSRDFVRTIEARMLLNDGELPPDDAVLQPNRPLGAGSKTLDLLDLHVIIALLRREPSRPLSDYRHSLYSLTGTDVSESTISRVLLTAFPYSSGFRRPNLVPYDKFRPENIARAMQYLSVMCQVDPFRVIFGDEKLLRGEDLFNRMNRVDPLTGEVQIDHGPAWTAAIG
jgi:hypothetical protein